MRTWMEINTDNLVYNVREIKKRAMGKGIIAVVKANSYGFGAVEIAKRLSEEKIVEMYAVACLDEALELREVLKEEKILVLGALLPSEIKKATDNDIQITVSNLEQLKFIEENNLSTKFHIKIDTGMGRLGFLIDEGKDILDECLTKKLNVVGIYSHLSDADGESEAAIEYTKMQIKSFGIFKEYEDILEYIHILNSGGILSYSDMYCGNYVRAGLCMYGLLGNKRVKGLKNIFEIKTKITSIRTVKEDTYISYGRTRQIKSDMTYVTLGIGYADGLPKSFSNCGYVYIDGKKCQIIGEVCMDMCMVLLENELIDRVHLGHEVTVLNNEIIEQVDFVRKCSWEILTGIGQRVYRVYKKNNEIYSIGK